MDEEVKAYRDALLADIRADAHVGGDYERARFIDKACQVLESGEEFTEYTLCRAHSLWKAKSVVQVDAYSFSRSDGVLSLVVADFSGDEEPDSIGTDEVRKYVQSAFRFLEGSVHSDVHRCWDESHEAHALSRAIFDFSAEDLTKCRIYLVSDREVSNQLGKIAELSLGTRDVDVQLWDIGRLARAETSTTGREVIQINFVEEYERGIPALAAGLGDESLYQSYMCIMPGNVLASLYDRFGGRILEQNVRAYLGEGRKVNKGIRETLRDNPEMFFAFNNGVTATVSSLVLTTSAEGQHVIDAVSDFQVVNGGQTTASLYWARKAKYDLSRVFVQMKLSKLPEEGFEEAVHDIARYANAQNAVSASDLFAGHPYFKRLETMSRQTLAPSAKSGDLGGYWYFERTQGSYNVEVRRKSGYAAKTWMLIHPKRQLLSKTDVARYEVTWASLPHSVCAGRQKNIAAFGKMISESWANDPERFDADYYKHLVAKAILTKAVDAEIPSQSWYPGSILRQLTSYTIALMADRLRGLGLSLDLDDVWRTQRAPKAFLSESMKVAKKILPLLEQIPEEQIKNRLVTEWAKRENCWERIKQSPLQLSDGYIASLPNERPAARKHDSWPSRAHRKWSDGSWARLREWNVSAAVLTEDEAELVERAALTAIFNFKGFRLKKLQEAWNRAVASGFV